MIVVDTTVIAAFLLDEGEPTVQARALKGLEEDWAVSPLWRWEYGNVLWKYTQRKVFTREKARQELARAVAYFGPLERQVPMDVVADVSFGREVTFYDAVHVGLARHLGVMLATGDRRLLQAAPDVAVRVDKLVGTDLEG